jgi:hypothetical protein
MPNGYATANLLRALNQHDPDALAPEVEAPRDTEYPTLVTRLMMAVGLVSLFAILLHDLDRRFNPQPPTITEEQIAATLDRLPMGMGVAKTPRTVAYEECVHMRLTWTAYTYSDCRTKDRAGRTVYHREGM